MPRLDLPVVTYAPCNNCGELAHEHEKRRVYPDDGPAGGSYHEYWCPGTMPDDLEQGVPIETIREVEEDDEAGDEKADDGDEAVAMTDGGVEDPILRKGGIQQRMQCGPRLAHNIEEAFCTVGKLVDAVESDEPITDVDGIGPKTAVVIEEWWENHEERERNAKSSTVKRTSSKSATITFHHSWADALGIEIEDQEGGADA